MDSYNANSVYSLPPCSGAACGGGTTAGTIAGTTAGYFPGIGGNPIINTQGNGMASMAGNTMMHAMTNGTINQQLPSLQEIAEYNYLNPQQQEQQRQMLATAGSRPFSGNPRQMTQTAPSNNILAPNSLSTQPMPVTAESLQYMNGFLRTQIGRPVKVDFLIGTNTLVDRTGILLGVGVNYILINEIESDDVVACDFYNIKFIKFYY